jgi:hypothetical protein
MSPYVSWRIGTEGGDVETLFRWICSYSAEFLIFSLHDDKDAAVWATPEFPFLDCKEQVCGRNENATQASPENRESPVAPYLPFIA